MAAPMEARVCARRVERVDRGYGRAALRPSTLQRVGPDHYGGSADCFTVVAAPYATARGRRKLYDARWGTVEPGRGRHSSRRANFLGGMTLIRRDEGKDRER